MRKLAVYIVISILGGILLFFVKKDSSFTEFAINVLASLFIVCLDVTIENYKQIKLFIQTKTKYRNTQIRLSIAYLYQIETLGKYLLVKGLRIPNQYQPVGGVYKRLRESYYELRNLMVTDDNNIPIDDKSHKDLRIKLPGCNVMKFLSWFDSQLGREVSPHREFHEELIKTGILDLKNFPYPN